ncbi:MULTISPECIES: FliM/FliN family flagellar motor switch protein [unclassified Roseivivax]|uniref:FliM/FliN family flagellar motor switch protein n=1 Tax=Roseivivax sp. GX 12232 TaxID=2900547 RepID=UPI001E315EA3|nr:FliM/FliN family flagellar motor switch protein [Roseivivax sp. GX 12232]MCE0503873.1 FliM/FliN family flagellar motor switch protein [Roseivivax sp. GX 12232]
MTDATQTREYLEEEIIRASVENVERLPMLEKIFERLLQGLSGALRSFSGVQAEPTFEDVRYLNMGPALNGIDPSWLTAICDAHPWDSRFVLALEPKLLFSLLEILLGGRTAAPSDWTPRSFTSIEKRLAQQITDTVLREFEQAFAPVEAVKFKLSHFETSPQSAMVAASTSPATRFACTIDLEGRGGGLVLVIPHIALDETRAKLSELFMGESIGHDVAWEHGMETAVSGTSVELHAILRQLRVPLIEALGWKPGTVIDLGVGPEDEVALATSGQVVAHGSMGRRRSGAAAVRISRTTFEEEGFIP